MSAVSEPVPEVNDLSAFYVADWYVDSVAGFIQRGNQVVRLEPKVMEILVFLASHPGQVIHREKLESTVWRGTVTGYDALTSSILKLRKAFDDHPKNPKIIETLPKRGYRLVAEVHRIDENHLASEENHKTQSGQTAFSPPRKSGYLLILGLLVVAFVSILYFLQNEQAADGSVEIPQTRISIAVLPFNNLNNDSRQDYFVDGITDDLITDLTRLSGLFVISRDSSFVYKGQKIDINKIAKTLKVNFVLHGSVRREQENVRINAQLTDTRTGNQIWAERYDGKTSNIFALQDQITGKIISALAIKLSPAERQNLFQPETDNLAAYDYFLQGTENFFRYARLDNKEARNFFQKAVDLDPKFARAYAMLAWTHAFDFMNGWSHTPGRSLAVGEELSTKALELNNNLPVAHFVRGLIYRERGDYAKALVDAELAVKLDPSYANGHVLHATLLYYADRPQEGLQKIKMAIRLNPHHPFNYPFHLGQAYFVLKRYSEAIQAFEDGLKSNPSSERLHVWLAASYARAGLVDEARWEMEQIKLVNPDISLARQQQAFPFKKQADLDHFLGGLRIAGLTR